MATGTLAAVGSKFGPCADECRHIDCAATRAQAASPCAICYEPIGYGVEFYDARTEAQRASFNDSTKWRADVDAWIEKTVRYWSESNFVHAACFEKLEELTPSERSDWSDVLDQVK